MKKKKIAFYLIFIFIIFIVIDLSFTFIFKKVQVYLINDQNSIVNHSTYHHELKKNYNGLGDRKEIINTNSYGLINLVNTKINFSNYKKNYIFIGDSFTQGSGVNYKDTYAGTLSKKFSDKEINIINLSTISYSPIIYYKKTKYFIENYNLKFSKMFLFLDISDPYDELYRYELKNDIVVERKTKKNYLKETLDLNFFHNLKQFISRNTTITYFVSLRLYNLILQKTEDDIKFFKKYGFIINHQANLWTYDRNYFDKEGFMGIELSKKYLLKLKDILDLQEAELTILVYPWPGQIYRDDKNSLQVKIWKEWAKNNNIKFINLFPLFFENGHRSENDRLKVIEKFYLQGDMHFNENGHRIVADYLWKELSINPN